jgi:2-dehydro-3-deoxyphosphogalactonate aldolase
MTLEDAMAEIPIVAILRGVRPEEALDHVQALHDAGIRIVETPLNSPEPLDSIKQMVEAFGQKMVCGAGTVLSVERVLAVADVGGRIIVSPDTRPDVIRAALKQGLCPMPGFGTATEAFVAYEAGARWLKLFPAATYGPGHIKALRAVVPEDATFLAVGGAGPHNMGEWWAAGARGFGLGSELYRPGQAPEVTAEKAVAAVMAFRRLSGEVVRVA